jgi:FeS assembly SUF system protein
MDRDHFKEQLEAGENPMSEGLTEEEIIRIRALSDGVREKAIEVLKLIHDPEIPVNIWDLGLIYRIDVSDNNEELHIKMTLTSPTCPVAEYIPPEVKKRLEEVITELKLVDVQLVWEPSWDQSMMSEEAQLILDMM